MKKTFITLSLSTLLVACAGQKTTPPVETFSFAPTTQTTPSYHTMNLRMMTASINPQFSNYSFIYRISDTQYLADPYRQFLSAPNIEITSYFSSALAPMLKTNLISADNLALANFALQENVTELYADYRNKSAPEAVLTIEFILYHCDGDNKSQAGTITLTARSSIAPNNPSSLLDGYQKNLHIIAKQLSTFINQKAK